MLIFLLCSTEHFRPTDAPALTVGWFAARSDEEGGRQVVADLRSAVAHPSDPFPDPAVGVRARKREPCFDYRREGALPIRFTWRARSTHITRRDLKAVASRLAVCPVLGTQVINLRPCAPSLLYFGYLSRGCYWLCPLSAPCCRYSNVRGKGPGVECRVGLVSVVGRSSAWSFCAPIFSCIHASISL